MKFNWKTIILATLLVLAGFAGRYQIGYTSSEKEKAELDGKSKLHINIENHQGKISYDVMRQFGERKVEIRDIQDLAPTKEMMDKKTQDANAIIYSQYVRGDKEGFYATMTAENVGYYDAGCSGYNWNRTNITVTAGKPEPEFYKYRPVEWDKDENLEAALKAASKSGFDQGVAHEKEKHKWDDLRILMFENEKGQRDYTVSADMGENYISVYNLKDISFNDSIAKLSESELTEYFMKNDHFSRVDTNRITIELKKFSPDEYNQREYTCVGSINFEPAK